MTRSEHNVRAVQMVYALQNYTDFYASLVPLPDARFEAFEIHSYMGDATSDELVQKKKAHVGFVFSASVTAEDAKRYTDHDGKLSITTTF